MLIYVNEEVDLRDRAASLINRSCFREMHSVCLGSPEYANCRKLAFEYSLRSVEKGAPVADALATEQVAIATLESLRSGQEVKLDATH